MAVNCTIVHDIDELRWVLGQLHSVHLSTINELGTQYQILRNQNLIDQHCLPGRKFVPKDVTLMTLLDKGDK